MTRQRTWNPVETRLLAEWMPRAFPAARLLYRVRLGTLDLHTDVSTLSPGEQRVLGVWRRWADGLVILPTMTFLVEAAVLPTPGDISTLDLYGRLWPSTPEFQDIVNRPVRLLLLYAVEDSVIEDLARERGIEVVYFCPPWAAAYVRGLYRRAASPISEAIPYAS